MTDSAAPPAPPPVVAITADLLLHSQLSAAADRVGLRVLVAMSIEALVAKAETSRPRMVILDLGHEGLDPRELVPRLKAISPEATIVAFGPHVHRQRLAAATEAGCDQVMSRGQFHATMEEILRRGAGGG
jgi:DNA-binding NarL/FixJ family response regulator